MESLKSLFQRPGYQGRENETFVASAVVAAANNVLRHWPGLFPEDGRALSYQRGIVAIQVKHGAVAGKLRMHEGEFVSELRNLVRRKFPALNTPIVKLSIRIG